MSSQAFNSVSGKVIDNVSNIELQRVKIHVLKMSFNTVTNSHGDFIFNQFPKGEYILVFDLGGFEIKKIPISISGNNEDLDLGIIQLKEKFTEVSENGVIELNEAELEMDETGSSNTISRILVSSKDIFLKTVAYEFSATFFKPRNLGSEYSQVMINGLVMNKLYNGRPQWSNWGGLNDVLRNQEFTINLSPSAYSFSDAAGSINFNTRASSYRKGIKISYALSNRSYKGRFMASYASGLLKSDWAFSFLISRRSAKEGYRDGSIYNSNSFFASVEKKISDKHSLNFTAIYASNIRGKTSPISQEIFDLKNIQYNSYWGTQNEAIRNSRIRRIEEPILQLNHYFNWNKNISIQNMITYQFGNVGNSRLDYGGTRIIIDGNGEPNIIGGGTNPDPTYYQKLPSYFLRDSGNPDYVNAYLAEQEIKKNGQINWSELYEANKNIMDNNGNSIYALYEDRNDDKQLVIKSILYAKIKNNITINGSVEYKKFSSDNFAMMLDLLGGSRFLDVDSYGSNWKDSQSDLQNPNRTVIEKERFKYNFILDASVLEAFAQSLYFSKKTDAFMAISYSNANYQRTGLYENGAFPGKHSLGKSELLRFANFSIKGGITYKLTGRHIFSLNASYLSKMPSLKNSFSNIRENNDLVIGLTNENTSILDATYFLRHPKISLKVSTYMVKLRNQVHISFYFADGLSGLNNAENTAFVQEILTGIDKQNIGLEFGCEVPLISGFKLKAAAAVGESIYTNNPNLYLTSDGLDKPLDYGKSNLKNYFSSSGPQHAYSIGFEYSSPKYWWFGITGNHFSNAYLSVSPINRTSNFYTDEDGLPFHNYDENIARELLKQEKLNSYYLVNAVGGKSWKMGDYYFGFFANISNILSAQYKTGGYEQSRNSNYKTLLKDKSRDTPLFGPKYWFGYGASYYASVYFRM